MGLGLGDFDKDSVHNPSTPTKRMPNMGRFPGQGGGMDGRDLVDFLSLLISMTSMAVTMFSWRTMKLLKM